MTERTIFYLIPLLLAALQWMGCEATGRDENPEEGAGGTGDTVVVTSEDSQPFKRNDTGPTFPSPRPLTEEEQSDIRSTFLPVREAETLTVYSLDSWRFGAGADLMDNSAIFDQANVPSSRVSAIADALEIAVREGEGIGIVFSCFEPHHALRSQIRETVTDFIICFSCRQVQIFRNGGRLSSYLISSSAEPTLNKFVRSNPQNEVHEFSPDSLRID